MLPLEDPFSALLAIELGCVVQGELRCALPSAGFYHGGSRHAVRSI